MIQLAPHCTAAGDHPHPPFLVLTRPLLPAVDFLRNPRPADEEEYGCDYDCPCFPQLWDYARAVVGGTLAGARKLIYEEGKTRARWSAREAKRQQQQQQPPPAAATGRGGRAARKSAPQIETQRLAVSQSHP